MKRKTLIMKSLQLRYEAQDTNHDIIAITLWSKTFWLESGGKNSLDSMKLDLMKTWIDNTGCSESWKDENTNV